MYNQKGTNYFCRFTFGQFFALLVLSVFTLFFVFYLGSRYGGTLLGVPPAATTVEQPAAATKIIATNPDAVLTTRDPEIKELAKDILENAKTPDLKQRVAELLEENTAQKAPPALDDVPHAASGKPLPESVTTPQAGYSIQVGSYPKLEEAQAILESWKLKGYPVFLVTAEIPEKGRWHRVRLGHFETKEVAGTFLKDFKETEQVEAFVVVNE